MNQIFSFVAMLLSTATFSYGDVQFACEAKVGGFYTVCSEYSDRAGTEGYYRTQCANAGGRQVSSCPTSSADYRYVCEVPASYKRWFSKDANMEQIESQCLREGGTFEVLQ